MSSTDTNPIPPLDFSLTPLSGYTGFYAKIIDSVFSPSECASLIDLATGAGDWQPAGLSTGGETQTVHSNFRNSDRVLVFNEETAAMVYERLRPYLEEIHEIAPGERWACVTGKAERKQGPTWRMTSVNSRLSFLRYGPGHYFKPHCDGLIDVPVNGVEHKSFVTLHLYLNDDGLEGGATRFWTPDKKHWLDVHPKLGRVLIFQQRMLVHSGEEVTKGVKYTMRSDFLFEQPLSFKLPRDDSLPTHEGGDHSLTKTRISLGRLEHAPPLKTFIVSIHQVQAILGLGKKPPPQSSQPASLTRAHKSCVNALAFSSSDGRLLASGGDDLWDFHQDNVKTPTYSFRGPKVSVKCDYILRNTSRKRWSKDKEHFRRPLCHFKNHPRLRYLH